MTAMRYDVGYDRPNITLSATSAGLLPPVAHMPYLPRHSACGMPDHLYVLLLRIGDTTAKLRTDAGGVFTVYVAGCTR